MQKFYLLEDACLKKFVSHVSFTGYSCLVTCCDDKLSSILLPYDFALMLRDFLQKHDSDCYGYNIVPFN